MLSMVTVGLSEDIGRDYHGFKLYGVYSRKGGLLEYYGSAPESGTP